MNVEKIVIVRSKKRIVTKRVYDTQQWKRLRLWMLKATPLCVHCQEVGLLTPAIEVDHITPIAQGGKAYDTSNLQCLCKSCHSTKTMNEVIERKGGLGQNIDSQPINTAAKPQKKTRQNYGRGRKTKH